MTADTQRRRCAAALAVLATLAGTAGLAAVPVHVVQTDLRPLIRAAAASPVQFAVTVPHAASSDRDGSWSSAAGRATWRYAVQVPAAVSLSFHAGGRLPAAATLVVRGTRTTTRYRAADWQRGELWSRIQPGDALQFELSVPEAARAKANLHLISLQVGYRSLGAGVADHPYYRKLLARQAAAAGTASCITNYACEVSAANTPAAGATVALIISNQFQCTGVLLNDVPGDNTPYILTGRHCQTGQLGGSDPYAAGNTTVYWDATTACGATLGSIYDPNVPTQSGALTLVEQQDAWLIQLNANPVVADAQLAGFDVSGGAVLGGYTIHHAAGNDKQYTAWSGPAAAVQKNDEGGSHYLGNFWETVNLLGNIGPGASGSGLFDQNNHLVGTLTLGRSSSDPSGYGACPVSPPAAPNGSNGVADFTSLAAVWNSTADSSSSSGTRTLKSVLDPADTGALVVAGAPFESLDFTTSATNLDTGQSALLSWSVPDATQCTAGEGLSGDGWSGTVPTSGSQSLTEAAGLTVQYRLTCHFANGRSASATVAILWYGAGPYVFIDATSYGAWVTRPVTLSWNSNVSPCSVMGGHLSLGALAASGSATTTESSPGDVTYQVSCGSGIAATSAPITISFVTPSLVFMANAADRRLGETFGLGWLSEADTCTPSGGAPDDGWAANAFSAAQNSYSPRVTTAGTYTYTLQCSSGPLSVQQSVTVKFENDPPYVTAAVSPAAAVFSDSPADYISVSWSSNLSYCDLKTSPDLGLGVDTGKQYPPNPYSYVDSVEVFAPSQSGTYTLSVTCGDYLLTTSVASAPMTVTIAPAPPPTATISLSPGSVSAGQNFSIDWSSTNAATCTESGDGTNLGGLEWGISTAPLGQQADSTVQSGSWTFAITCHSIDPNQPATASAQAVLTVRDVSSPPPSSGGSSGSGSGSGAGGGGGGGGGALGLLELGLFWGLRVLRRRPPAKPTVAG